MTPYQLAVSALEVYDFPKLDVKAENIGEFHRMGKVTHDLITKEQRMPSIQGLPCIAKWNFCPECKTTRNRSITLLGDKVVYVKKFTHHGESVHTSQDLPLYDDWLKEN